MDFLKLNKQLLALFLLVLSVLGLVIIINEIRRGQYIGVDVSRLQTISFTGEGKAAVAPDLAEVSLSVFSQGFDLKKVQDENTKKMNAITAFLDEQKIDKKDRQTSQYNIYPRYDWTQSGQRFLGYEVRQTLTLKIRDFGKIAPILDQAVAKGANEVGSLIFAVEDKDKVQAEARAEAIAEAKAKAEQLAKDLGIKLGKIVNFQEGGSYPTPVPLYAKEAALGLGGGGAAPDIQSGENEFVSSVTITYQIEY